MNDPKVNKLILRGAYITIIVLIIAVIALLILKYDVEGERNIPFKLSNIIITSSAEGYQEKENSEYKWDIEIYQNNEIYLNIEKNKNYKETELIKSVQIENIHTKKEPEVGAFKFNINNLKISNKGGTIIISAVNQTGKKYKSNEKQLEHNGKLLEKAEISYKQVRAIIEFDLIINLESNISYRSTIEVDLPTGNIIEQGYASIEIKDMKNIIYKRN